MIMSKGLKTFLPVWLVFAVVVSVITWVIPVDHNELFFIGYGFIMGSLLLQLVVVVISMKNEQND